MTSNLHLDKLPSKIDAISYMETGSDQSCKGTSLNANIRITRKGQLRAMEGTSIAHYTSRKYKQRAHVAKRKHNCGHKSASTIVMV